ncbi:universal stress protein [Marilutibacter chinensis]|uniref:Universal stress protein n=1 Tax=Marilutibacter chinensis TaxID=2912247 RepID=A0ABS9HPR9_9GAMM|nr:universal stress protein [Lysobacter chinensis]MCF7220350.1 universal stress protein [Lysobacter chinensis]
MFKDILLPLLSGRFSEPALSTACALAKTFRGHVVVLLTSDAAASEASMRTHSPGGIYALLQEHAGTPTWAHVGALRERLARAGVAFDIRQADGFWLTAEQQSVTHARYADLVVLGIERESMHAESRRFSSVVVEGGRPVLLVPPQAADRDAWRHVVIAWKSTPEAARAVHDALPILRRADTVDLLMVDNRYESHGIEQTADAAIVPCLSRHGLQVNLVRRSAAHSSIGEEVLAYAGECGADLIVAGAYSRPRALERLFGGVTRTLLERTGIPVMFSH